MTARPEAPTLDELIAATKEAMPAYARWEERGRVAGDDALLQKYSKIVTPQSILASLERLRAIEQAAGMPEPPVFGHFDAMCTAITHIDKLTDHCLHLADNLRAAEENVSDFMAESALLNDRLARMEALLREPAKKPGDWIEP